MQILILQSADRTDYARLLEASAPTAIEFCRRHGCDYESFLGIKRGAKPWHAALNRIPIIRRYLDEGYRGWIVWMDADAYVADLDFDLRGYLADKQGHALIAAHGGAAPHDWWNINNGVFAINLGHPVAGGIVTRWHDKLMAVPEAALAAEPRWSMVIDDQVILHEALKETEGAEAAFLPDDGVFNWQNRFIRQIVRETGSLDHRVRRMRRVADEVLGRQADARPMDMSAMDAHREYGHALYHVLLGRDPDETGITTLIGQLGRGERTYTEEMRACLRSTEFEHRAQAFLREYLTPDGFAWLGREMVR